MYQREYIEINAQGNHSALSITPPRKLFLRPVILIANSALAVIRTVPLPDGYKHNAKTQWEQVLAAFPIGRALNEKTHLFDGSVYRNAEGCVVFCMIALPLDIADAITEHAAELQGGLRKVAALETMETVLFRHYCTNMADAPSVRWVIYPCEDGIKVLIIRHNAPEAVRFLPLAPPHFESALRRTLEESPPDQVLLPKRLFWGEAWVQTCGTLAQFFKSETIEVSIIHL